MKLQQTLLNQLRLLLLLLFIVTLSACATTSGTGNNIYYNKYLGNLTVDNSLQPFANHTFSLFVPTDVSGMPSATTFITAYADSQPTLTRSAHTIVSTISKSTWKFKLELSPELHVLDLTKSQANGQYETIQIMPVIANADFFSALYEHNGKQIPAVWLAKRWSSTPLEQVRVIREYREAAPQCIQDNLGGELNLTSSKRFALWAICGKEIEAFSQRADGIFAFSDTPAMQPLVSSATMPDARPNMKYLVGKAEPKERSRIWRP